MVDIFDYLYAGLKFVWSTLNFWAFCACLQGSNEIWI